MAIKKGDLVKVIKLIGLDSADGVELNKTYKVHRVCYDYVEIDAGKGDRCMFYSQIEIVKNMSKQEITSEQIMFMKSILLSQLLLEANESLITTDRYKQDLKQQGNRMIKMLEPIVRESFDVIYDSDPMMTTNILNKVDNLINRIAKLKTIEEVVILESIVDKYENNKEWFMTYAESEFLKID